MKGFNAGRIVNQKFFNNFQPDSINKQWEVQDMELLHLLSIADRLLGRLDMLSQKLPGVDNFIGMQVMREAVQSCKLGGAQITVRETLFAKEKLRITKRDAWEDVRNYLIALPHAIHLLEDHPFSTKIIKETHKKLLQGERGTQFLPGVFRISQNRVGGASKKDPVFVPPVHTSIEWLMDDLDKFAQNDELFLPDLIKIGLIQYQFETIHPFLEGNGRMARLLAPLYLVDKGILKKPVLYLSGFFEANKELYYRHLTRVRTHHDIREWLKFFMVGVIESAEKGIKNFEDIINLKQQTEITLQTLGTRAQNAQKILQYLFTQPVIEVATIEEITGASKRTAYNLLDDLEGLKILKETTGGKRGRLYLFEAYVDLFE